MTVYDDKLYAFLTKPENFEPFVDLKEQYDKVIQRLVNEFWAVVLEEANNLKPGNMQWQFSLDEPKAANRKLRASHPDISLTSFKAGIVYEYLDADVLLGVWFDRREYVDPAMTYIWDDAKSFLKNDSATKDDPNWKVGNNGWWFAIYRKPGLNLSQKSFLLQSIPEVRTSLAKTYAELFVSAVEQLGPFCLQQAKKR